MPNATKYRRTVLLWIVAAVTVAPIARAQTAPSTAPAAPAVERVTQDLRWLADDAREGRGVGTDGLDAAAQYIADAFAAAGLEPGGTDGFFQPFELDANAPALTHSSLGGEAVKNVIGILPGRGALANETVILGAHYDHLGLGEGYQMSSRDSAPLGKIHNGADDNASGTSALLEAARNLAARPAADRRALVFIAFTAEELGLFGSKYYVNNPALPLEGSVAMLNFDMVGRLRNDSVTVGGTGSSPELAAALMAANEDHGLHIAEQETPWGSSDHAAFYPKNIPVLHFYTKLHGEYHTPADDSDFIEMDGIVRIAELASDLAQDLATRTAPVTYAVVVEPEPVNTGPRASLGSVPDMTTSGIEGMRLDGVRAGTAAEKAGLQAGDVIISIGEITINGIYDLQTALTTYKAGDTVTIVFTRDGERMETEATLQ
jgi:Zn-dependent M28 family amino/carboxypeptidase